MWANDPSIGPNVMIIRLAFRTWESSTDAAFEPAKGSYIIDDNGKKLDLVSDDGDYGWLGLSHTCKGDEVCQIDLEFPPIDHPPKYLLLHHPQFATLRFDFEYDPKP